MHVKLPLLNFIMLTVLAQEVESFIYPTVSPTLFLISKLFQQAGDKEAGGIGAFSVPFPPMPGRDLSAQTQFTASVQHAWEEGFLVTSG